jgi:predicted TIM-barrel fold metal-dependent hydrolase
MAPKLDFPVFDSDNHLYETEDSFLRHLPAKYHGAIRYVEVDGRTKIAIRNVISDYIPNPTFEVVARPGAFREYVTGDNPEGKTLREITGKPMRSIPAFREPEARLDVLDEFAVDGTLVFPTLASVLEVNLMDDPDLALAAIHSFNQWLHEQWTFNYKGRIFATPVINLSTCEGGIAELEWVLERGAKVVLIRPAAVGGYRGPRSPFLAEFDPFWARVQESGILVTLHLSDSGYTRFANEWDGAAVGEWRPFAPSPFQTLSIGHRPIMDAMYSIVAHGMLSRFPGVKVASVENGSDWVPRILEDFKSVYGKMPQEFVEDPVEVFQRQVWVNPFWEDPIDQLVDLLGADKILFGSDWPHGECLDDPLSWAEFCEKSGIASNDVAKMMGNNLSALMGVVPASA